MTQYFNRTQKIRLLKSLFMKTNPAYIQFYITARCNLSCEQCNINYANADSQEMSIYQIQAMAENMAKIGVCIVLLIGGEPFVRKDIAEIVKAFTDVGIHVRMQTNGLASKKILYECVEAGGHDISISLDSLEPALQDKINGNFLNSWSRAIKTVAYINEIFPENGTAFFGTVLMPRNLNHIVDVIEFATAIGWGVSLVPAHATTPEKPRGFRTFDDREVCKFKESTYPRIKEVLEEVKEFRDKGLNIYDSDEYLDDIYRFIVGKPLKWRKRNNNICDSPNLYFSVEPNGNISPCCDYKLDNYYPVYHKNFPVWYNSGKIHKEIYTYTHNCEGCMYGSYPEITITARYLKPMFHRFLYFNKNKPELKKMTVNELTDIAKQIWSNNKNKND